LWLVANDSLKTFELPGRAEIERDARETYAVLNNPQALKTIRGGNLKRGTGVFKIGENGTEALIKLSRTLLTPVAKEIEGKRLIVVGDGALQFIPFAALNSPSADAYKPLILQNEIVSLPSASTLAVLRHENAGRTRAPQTLAIFADPVFDLTDSRIIANKTNETDPLAKNERISPVQDFPLLLEKSAAETNIRSGDVNLPRLPGTRREASAILSFVKNGKPLTALDFDASRKTIVGADLSQYRIVHFATHGFLNSQHPELSGIALTMFEKDGNPQDGFFRLNEVFNLKLNADLVVLSACQTGLGKEIKGEGLIGLTRGFMYAGSPRVAVSLWSVSDDGTAELMTRFYANLLKKQMRPAKALQEAQISLFKDKKYSAPYYWAAFTLQGEWR
jgi:CHAT domain-containing protein